MTPDALINTLFRGRISPSPCIQGEGRGEGSSIRHSYRKFFLVALCAVAILQLHVPAVRAVATPEDIERSFNQSMDSAPDYSKLIPWVFLLAGIIAVVVYFNQRQKKEAIQKPLNHPKKLVREVARLAEIDAADMKQLKRQAEELGCENPLTLLLCPSLMNAKPADLVSSAEPDVPDELAA